MKTNEPIQVPLSPHAKSRVSNDSPKPSPETSKIFNYGKFYQRSSDKKKRKNMVKYSRNNSKMNGESKLKQYMTSVSSMYNEQMKKMQQNSMHSRLYDQLKASKAKEAHTSKGFNSFSMNGGLKSTSSLKELKEDTQATNHFLRENSYKRSKILQKQNPKNQETGKLKQSYQKYLISPVAKVRQTKKFSPGKLLNSHKDNTESGNNSQSHASESSGILKSSTSNIQTQDILVFPYKKMMPHELNDHRFPHEFENHVLSATKQYIHTQRDLRPSPFRSDPHTPVMSGNVTKGMGLVNYYDLTLTIATTTASSTHKNSSRKKSGVKPSKLKYKSESLWL